jgi:hypothetical protein
MSSNEGKVMKTWRSWPKKRWNEAGFIGAPEHEEQAKRMALAAIRNISMSEFMAILGRKDEYAGHGSELYNLINDPLTRRSSILHAFFGKKIPDMRIHRHKAVWVCQDCGDIKHGLLLCGGTKMLFTECSDCKQMKPCMDIGR